MRALVALAAVAIVAGSLWYVVAPPRAPSDYRERADQTARTLRSQIQTARLWARAVARDETTGAAAVVGLEDAERRAEQAAAKFAAYQPPRGTDRVRADLMRLATDVADELGRLQIAATRGDWDHVRLAEPRLERLASRIEAFRRRGPA